MTLTLPMPEKAENRGSYICAVDLNYEEEAALKAQAGQTPVVSVTHTIENQSEFEFQDAMNMVERYLKLYGNAKCVLTTRLHCALPCLAMGTPVVLINDCKRDNPLRFSSFLKLLHTISPQDLKSGKLSFDILDPPPNPNRYISIRKSLISRMKDIIQNGVEIPQKNDGDEAEDKKRRLLWQRKLTNQMIKTASRKIVFLTEKNAEMANWIKELKMANDELMKKNEEIQKWAEAVKKSNEEYSQKNEELMLWGLDCKKQMDALMKKNQELFDWAKSLEKRIEEFQ